MFPVYYNESVLFLVVHIDVIPAYISFRLYFCFSKQKPAYERRIRDWSSDVCSSDLLGRGPIVDARMGVARGGDLVRDRRLADQVQAPHLGRLDGDRMMMAGQVVDKDGDARPPLVQQPAYRLALAAAAADHRRAEPGRGKLRRPRRLIDRKSTRLNSS